MEDTKIQGSIRIGDIAAAIGPSGGLAVDRVLVKRTGIRPLASGDGRCVFPEIPVRKWARRGSIIEEGISGAERWAMRARIR
jgi:hypothetical protein